MHVAHGYTKCVSDSHFTISEVHLHRSIHVEYEGPYTAAALVHSYMVVA